MRVRRDDQQPELPVDGSPNDEIGRFFESFEDHFFENPDYDIPGDLDANICGHTATISWSTKHKGEDVDFACRRIVGRESKQWITFQDGVRQLAPQKDFDPVGCASAMKRAIESMKRVEREGA